MNAKGDVTKIRAIFTAFQVAARMKASPVNGPPINGTDGTNGTNISNEDGNSGGAGECGWRRGGSLTHFIVL
jgi:hypothetical protein